MTAGVASCRERMGSQEWERYRKALATAGMESCWERMEGVGAVGKENYGSGNGESEIALSAAKGSQE